MQGTHWLSLSLLSFITSTIALPHPNIPHQTSRQAVQKPQVQAADCLSTAIGFAHPFADPSRSTITITKQGQAVPTFISTASRCSNGVCEELFSTSTYNWYSTWLPGPNGPQFVKRGDASITLPPSPGATLGPNVEIRSHFCTKNGIHTINGQPHQMNNAPGYIYYAVENGSSHQISNVHDYYQWLHNGECLQIEHVSCDANGVCTQQAQMWHRKERVTEEVRWMTAEFSGYCAKAGECKLAADRPGQRRIEIVVEVGGGGVIRTVTSTKITLTRTHIVTKTSTRGYMDSPATTVPETTRPTVAPQFRIAVDITPFGRNRKHKRAATKLNPDFYVRIDDGFLTYSNNPSDALPFSIPDGKLMAENGSMEGFIDGVVGRRELASYPIKVGTPGENDFEAPVSSFNDGVQQVMVWDGRKSSLSRGTALGQFCARSTEVDGQGRIHVFWGPQAPKGCELCSLFILDEI